MRLLLVSYLLIASLLFACSEQTKEKVPLKIANLIQENSGLSLHEAASAYEYGEDGVKRDVVEAARLYYLASQKGNYHSDYAIWSLWEEFSSSKGLDPPFDSHQFLKSKHEAIAGYTRLLLKHPDDSEIYYRLGLLYDPGIGIDNQEARTAKAFIEKAAHMGHAEAKEILKIYSNYSSYCSRKRVNSIKKEGS